MTTDIVARDDGLAPDVIGSAYDLASKVSATEFVPGALRNKPDAVMACILMGREIGVGPMQSLSKIHVVDGRPAMAAELMRARALESGHEIWIEEKSSTKVTVAGKRRGSDHVSRVTWTMDDAKRAGIQGKNNWRKYPRAMLTARATAELCRDIFADTLGGVSYAMEEVEDLEETGDGQPLEPEQTKTAKKGTHRRRSPQRRQEAPAAEDGPPLPHELDDAASGDTDTDDGDVVDAEVVDDGHDQDADDGLESMTVAQLKIRCRKRDLPVSGTKDELIGRLRGEEVEEVEDAEPDDGDDGPPLPIEDGEGFGEPSQRTGQDADDGDDHDDDRPCTEAQRKKLFAVLREHGISDRQRKAVIRNFYGVASLNDVPAVKVAKLIDALERDGGPDQFKALADEWLQAEQDAADQQIAGGDAGQPGPDACTACGEIIAGEHDCGTDDAPAPEPTQEAPLTPAERAYQHANGDTDTIGRLATRIRGSFSILAVHNDTVYRGGWGRLQKITDGRAAETDWTGASEAALAALAEDMERAARDAMADDGGGEVADG